MKGKRILSAVLSAALLLQLSPLAVFAENTSLLPAAAQTVQTEPAPEEPTQEPAREETALPEEPAPEETAVPMAAPTPEPAAEPTAAPAPEATPAPDAAATPAPEPSAEPTAAPDPAAEVQAMIDALPDEVTEDNAEAVEQALTDIDDAKESLTDDELAGLDLTRYDAAANALLALLGEAPADAVETLDDYPAPQKGSDDYYQITNERDLRWFAQAVNGGKRSINARLMNDITVDKNTQWTPIGTEAHRFKGIFDGNGKTITGLTYTDTSVNYVGLVGYADDATIQDVTVQGSSFNGNDYIGTVCGFIVGGTITGCTNSGSTVSGSWKIGGIAGKAKYTNVQRCVNTGKVSGKNNLGGIVGCTEDARVQDCGNTGNVKPTGIGRFCGGIAGSVLGSSHIHNCYNVDSSTADKFYDGSCYHSNCYYLANGSDSTDKEIITKTQAQFASGEVAFLLQGNRTEPVWGQEIGTNDYPKLGGDKVYQSAPCPAGYSNTQGEVRQHNYVDGVCSLCGEHEPPKEVNGYYQITNQWQLYWFAKWVNGVSPVTTEPHPGANAILVYDITLNSNVLNENGELNTGASVNFTPWTLIGTNTNPFTGTFNGNNKTISGLYFNDSGKDDVGLFGCVGTNGTVKDVTLADSYVSGKSYVGGICGANMGGTLQGCHNTGTVSGNSWVGGVCGSNSGTLQESYNTGEVSGTTQNVGGVCGYNFESGILQGCYNNGNVTGTGNCVGGVCGQNNSSSTVKRCYNTGEVIGNNPVGSVCGWNGGATVEKCYYLAGTSAKAVGDGSGNRNETCESKTELQFQNGDVAFCLQNDLGGAGVTQVWGQRIDTDKTPVLSNNPDYAVHPAAEGSICKRYSNKPNQKFTEHEYDEETRVCSRCGESKPLEAVNGYYEIFNQDQLREFANQVKTTSDSGTKLNARLMNDITMDGTEWTPIGTDEHPFTGTFDGNSKTITGLKCTDTSAYYVGLVGYASGATIQNVTVQESSLSGKEDIGGVCGYIKDGTITNCHAVKTAIGDSRGFAEFKDYGGIVGHITGETTNVTDCTNSDGTVNGGYDLGGIVGFAGSYTTVQRCFNSGAVTGQYGKFGGIVGQAKYVTVQDCGNTGAVRPADGYDPVYYGGIIGENLDGSTIENCYNTDSNTADKIYGSYFCDYRNCYYLTNNPGSSGSTDPNITAKTAEQFASGEVAYLLQNGHGDTAVWGQTIGKDKYPKLGGDKVYQSAPCTADYSNTEIPPKQHVIGNDGKCTNCGAQCIAYTVTIPATVELGTTATIKAKDVILPNGKTLNVKVAEGSEFEVAQADDNDAVVDKCAYTVTKGETKTPVNPSDTVLTVVNGVAESSVKLQFNKPETTTYSGEYKGKVTFTVSVDDKPAS